MPTIEVSEEIVKLERAYRALRSEHEAAIKADNDDPRIVALRVEIAAARVEEVAALHTLEYTAKSERVLPLCRVVQQINFKLSTYFYYPSLTD